MNENKSGLCTASMVLGIISAVTGLLFCIGFLPGVLGLIFAIVCLAKKKTPKGKAIAGLITSIVGIILSLISTTVGVVVISIVGLSFGAIIASIGALFTAVTSGGDIFDAIENIDSGYYSDGNAEDYLNLFNGTDYENYFDYDDDGNLIINYDNLYEDYNNGEFDDLLDTLNNTDWENFNYNDYDYDDYDYDDYGYDYDDYNYDDYGYDYDDYDYDDYDDYDYYDGGDYSFESGNIVFDNLEMYGFDYEYSDNMDGQPYVVYYMDGSEYDFPLYVYDDWKEYGNTKIESFTDWMYYWQDDEDLEMLYYSNKIQKYNNEWEYAYCQYSYDYGTDVNEQCAVFAYSKTTNDYAVIMARSEYGSTDKELEILISCLDYMHIK